MICSNGLPSSVAAMEFLALPREAQSLASESPGNSRKMVHDVPPKKITHMVFYEISPVIDCGASRPVLGCSMKSVQSFTDFILALRFEAFLENEKVKRMPKKQYSSCRYRMSNRSMKRWKFGF